MHDSFFEVKKKQLLFIESVCSHYKGCSLTAYFYHAIEAIVLFATVLFSIGKHKLRL